MYSWIFAMRKKPIEERRRFVALSTIIVMAVITILWFLLFFTGLPERLKKAESAKSQPAAASMVQGFGNPAKPFTDN